MRHLKWAITNGIFAGSLFLWFYRGIEGFQNVAMFMAWFAIVGSWAALIAMSKKDPKMKESVKNSSAGRAYGLIFDAIVTLTLAYYGATVTAVFYLLHMLIGIGLREEVEKE